MAELTPFALKNAPALMESVFPVQKVSFEAQRERKSGASQTLTALGSYWKGRKPLILVRAIILGMLLPPTDDQEGDLEIFEYLLSFDLDSLAKRASAQNSIKPADIAEKLSIVNPWDYFSHNKKTDDDIAQIKDIEFPVNLASFGLALRWRKDIDEKDKLEIIKAYLCTFESYEDRSLLTKRPEELNEEELTSHIWTKVNSHYESVGINARSLQELVEQLGIARFGRVPHVADTFSGGGSIPFEAARVGCSSYASDLNPISCMLSWGALNILGASRKNKILFEEENSEINKKIEQEIRDLGIENDDEGNRAKAFLYCLEVICPQTGWRIPLLPTRILSVKYKTIVNLVPNDKSKSFDIVVFENASKDELEKAKVGTISSGVMKYSLRGKSYETPIKTLRGDFKGADGNTYNRLRKWDKHDFFPRADDLYQERLYAIQWVRNYSNDSGRQETFFRSIDESDIERENVVISLLKNNGEQWQNEGLLPDLEIEPGYNTSQPIRERGWTHWHHLFGPRALFLQHLKLKHSSSPVQRLRIARDADRLSKLCRYNFNPQPTQGPKIEQVFSDQALNPLFNWGVYSFFGLEDYYSKLNFREQLSLNSRVCNHSAAEVGFMGENDLYITDPPYADAVNYHEITEFFIAWLRKNPPKPFDEWTWDSRRALAIKGSGDDFRKGMVKAYKAMADHMPDNGMQCVMFTHQDTGVWSDMIGIFWASGLQVVGAWYIATETTSELKKGGYVQGTVILMLRKRPAGENAGFKQRLLPAVRAEVKRQIETMMHLNDEVKDKLGEPVFNDSDLQMAGYAAALKVLTSYTHIGGEDVTSFALRPRTKGEVTVVDEIVQQAAEAANSLLVPEGLTADTWQKINGIQRFYLRMMDIETTGASKLDNYQNFAKAFRVEDYGRVMGNMTANKAQLKRIPEFASRDLTDSTEIGSTWLGHLIIGLQEILNEKEPQTVISQLQADLPDFMEVRPILIDMLTFIEKKAPEKATRDAAEVLGARLKNMRALGQ